MKRFILSALLCAVCLTVAAQTVQPSQSPKLPVPGATTKTTHFNVSFEARHSEAFTVFIDGDPVKMERNIRIRIVPEGLRVLVEKRF